VAEEYFWAITGGEAVILRPIGFQCADVSTSAGLSYVFDYMYTEVRLAENLTCSGSSGT
jgi:hypothetical protein